MKPITIAGIILIILGLIALAYQGITYTSKEEALKVGPIKVISEKERTIPLSPVVGAAALGAGILLVIVGVRGGRAG